MVVRRTIGAPARTCRSLVSPGISASAPPPAGQPCDLTVRRDATFGDSANERVNAFDEQPPPANRANTTNGASRANKRRNKECAIGHVFPLFLAFAMFAG